MFDLKLVLSLAIESVWLRIQGGQWGKNPRTTPSARKLFGAEVNKERKKCKIALSSNSYLNAI